MKRFYQLWEEVKKPPVIPANMLQPGPTGNVRWQNTGSVALFDISLKNDYLIGFSNMKNLISDLLQKDTVAIDVEDAEANNISGQPFIIWDKIYSLNEGKSHPDDGEILCQWWLTKNTGILGKMWFTLAKYPLEKIILQKGFKIIPDPETNYLNEFVMDVRKRCPAGDLTGVEDWDFTTSGWGRDIIVTPKEEYFEKYLGEKGMKIPENWRGKRSMKKTIK